MLTSFDRIRAIVFTLAATLLIGVSARADVLLEHTGANDPTTENFLNSGVGTFGPVYNDLGLGINAWNEQGSWCCSYYTHSFTSNEIAALTGATNWEYTVKFRNLSTDTAPTQSGIYAAIDVNDLRIDLNIHSDGNGNQILSLNPFTGSPSYTIPGLGMNYVTLQMLYNNTAKTADIYVNGTPVITGYAGWSDPYGENWANFGGENGNFNLVELETNVPEPSSLILLASGSLGLVGILRRKSI